MSDQIVVVRSRWPALLLGFVLGSVVTVAAAGGLYLYWAGRSAPADPPAAPVFTRAEFTEKVSGKTEDEVIAAVGRPDSTSEGDDGKFWHYKRRTRDPAAESVDTDVQVVIQGGRVVAVNY